MIVISKLKINLSLCNNVTICCLLIFCTIWGGLCNNCNN